MPTKVKLAPIEVWLRQSTIDITCTVVAEDETTSTLDVESVSFRGAMREVTGYLIAQGYLPVGVWRQEVIGSEAVRTFRSA